MTSPATLKDNLIEQYNQTIVQLQKLEGAIAACNELLSATEEETTTEETPDA